MSNEKFYEVSEETKKLISEIWDKKHFADIRYKVIGNQKLKSIIKVSKVPDIYLFLTQYEILISVNEADIELLANDSAVRILVEQSINRIEYDLEKESIKIKSMDLNTSAGIVQKYGAEEVFRANELILQMEAQKKEKKEEEV